MFTLGVDSDDDIYDTSGRPDSPSRVSTASSESRPTVDRSSHLDDSVSLDVVGYSQPRGNRSGYAQVTGDEDQSEDELEAAMNEDTELTRIETQR